MATGAALARAFTILLVEDDDDHAELARRCLSEHLPEAEVRNVRDGQAALDYLGRRGEFEAPAASPRPDLILLDLRLPRIDGLTVLHEIKSRGELQGVPVVVLTSSDARADIARAYEEHANSYLVKPMDFDRFDRLMRDLGLYWRGWNRQP